jgi:predicted TIM-barrel fold metal-dependent hydrolase
MASSGIRADSQTSRDVEAAVSRRTYRVFSADDHIYEPPHIFDELPKHLRDIAPQPVKTDQGDGWRIKPGDPPMLIGGAARAAKSVDEVWTTTVTFENMAAGAYEPAARVIDLELDGVDAQVLYPQIMRHGLRRCATAEVRAAVARTYNAWIVSFDRFDASRFVGLAVLPPLDDGDEVIDILREARSLGLRGAWLTLSDSGKPIHHPDFEHFWATAAELDLPISLHMDPLTSPFDRAIPTEYRTLSGIRETSISLAGVALGEQLGHLIFSGMFDRYPQLRVVLAESGVGWIPYLLDHMDDTWLRFRGLDRTRNERAPSDIAHAQVYATFERDLSGILTRSIWGVDNMMWASDYPHLTSTFPDSHEAIERLFGMVTPEERDKMTCTTVAGLYGLHSR